MYMGEHQTMDEWEGGEDDDEGDAAEDLHGRRYCQLCLGVSCTVRYLGPVQMPTKVPWSLEDVAGVYGATVR